MSTAIWNYSYNLPGGFQMTVIVKAQQADDDFNLYIYDPNGNEIAQDDSPDANAYCIFTTTSNGSYQFKLERLKGSGGFSLKMAAGYLPPPAPPQPRPSPFGSIPSIYRRRPSSPQSAKPQPPPIQPTPKPYQPPTPNQPVAKTKGGLTAVEMEEMLNAHNQWRQRYGVPPLKWSSKLAEFAQEWADELAERGFELQHRPSHQRPYGENLAASTGRGLIPTQVVDMWGKEVKDYDYATNTCRRVCGHYTQVVWRNTTEVGCGVVRIGHEEVWVCNYNPPGNYIGQKPY
jgi:uncharacterized protein YkwD